MLSKEKLLYEADTPFDHYQVVDLVYEGRKSRILFSGNREAAFSGMPLDDNSDLLFDYIQRLFELVATTRPKKLLLIGGGTYTLPTALVHALPDIHIDVVEIDEALDPIAEAFFNYTPSDRINIYHTDGKSYLETTNEVYDLVIIDAFSGLKIPQSLANKAAAELVRLRLKPNGLVAVNILSGYQGANAQPLKHFIDVYAQSFLHSTPYPADSSQSSWSPQNIILVSENNTQPIHHGLRFGSINIMGTTIPK